MAKNIISVVFALAVLSFVFGCKQKAQEAGVSVPLKEGALSNTIANVAPAQPGMSSVPETILESGSIEPQKVENSEGFFMPSQKEIQQALKNSGLYNGEIDGKIGPKTKASIEEFQAKNNLQVDGKVGPDTWSRLQGYLNLESASSSGIKEE